MNRTSGSSAEDTHHPLSSRRFRLRSDTSGSEGHASQLRLGDMVLDFFFRLCGSEVRLHFLRIGLRDGCSVNPGPGSRFFKRCSCGRLDQGVLFLDFSVASSCRALLASVRALLSSF